MVFDSSQASGSSKPTGKTQHNSRTPWNCNFKLEPDIYCLKDFLSVQNFMVLLEGGRGHYHKTLKKELKMTNIGYFRKTSYGFKFLP